MREYAPQSLDDWMAENASPAGNYTFGQYGRYIEGWRASMPWAWKGMSVAYDNWAGSRWKADSNPDAFKLAWRMALMMRAKSIFGGEPTWAKDVTLEEVADFALSFPETIASCIVMAVSVLSESGIEFRPENMREIAEFSADRVPGLMKFDLPQVPA